MGADICSNLAGLFWIVADWRMLYMLGKMQRT